MKLKLSKNHLPTSKAWQVLKPLEQYHNEVDGIDTVWGLGVQNSIIVQNAVNQDRNWLFTDMPYWNRYDPSRPNDEFHWRTCVNNIHCNNVFDLPNDRSKHIELKDWRVDGEYILVAPSSSGIHNIIGQPEWLKKTLNRLLSTDLPVKVRYKPRKNGTSGPHVADIPLIDDLRNAKYVVTSCSIVGVEAIIEGIPTFCEPQSACAPVAGSWITSESKSGSFSLVPAYPDRQMWLNTLSYHQWTSSEFSSGRFASEFGQLYPEVFK